MNKYFHMLGCLCITTLSIQMTPAKASDLCTYPDIIKISGDSPEDDIHLIGTPQVSGSAYVRVDSDNKGFVISGRRECYGNERSDVTATIGIDQLHQCTITIHNEEDNEPHLSQSNCTHLILNSMRWVGQDPETYDPVFSLWFSTETLTPKK